MAERSEISRHEVEVFRVLIAHADTWQTNKELAEKCAGVATRTVRAMTMKFVRLGLIDQAEVFPAHKFKWAPKADKRNGGYLQRLKAAADVFGIQM